jgi:DNA-binding transcriptional LysR family regulator
VVTGGDTRGGESLFEDSLLVAVPRRHRLAGRASVKPAELSGERWVAGSTDASTALLGAWATHGEAPEIAYVARDWTAKLGLVAAGRAITIVPGMLVSALPTSVEVVRIDHPAATRTTWLVLRPEHEAAARFGEALRDSAATIAAETRRRLRD